LKYVVIVYIINIGILTVVPCILILWKFRH